MDVRPFRGWRYSLRDVSSVIAPPYDVLAAEDKQKLLGRSDRNIATVDLPHVPPGDVGPAEAYQAAAQQLKQWQADGTLIQDERPCLYAYEQTFTWARRSYTRRSILCGVRAGQLGRDVIPHEHTFEGPKADRLKLTECTGMQLSAIFGFFEDPAGEATDTLWSAVGGEPEAHGQINGVAGRLWAVSGADVIDKVTAALRDAPVFIADGHHRYATAAAYRDALRAAERIDDDHEANFVMFALVSRADPGLLILPTHRIVRNMKADFEINKLVEAAGAFSWQRCSVEDADVSDVDGFLHRYGPGAMALLGADPAEIWIGKLRDRSAMTQAAPDEPDAWCSLDVAVLHKLIIDRALVPWRTEELFVDYTPDGRSVLAACQSQRAQLGVLLQATPLEAVERLALVGGAMPHKSTYFYPKLATGMVIKPLG